MMLSNPTPNRPETVVAPAAMVETVERMQASRTAFRDRRAAQDKRFEVPGPFADPPARRSFGEGGSDAMRHAPRALPTRRRGILDREEELGDQLVALGGGKEDAWKQSV